MTRPPLGIMPMKLWWEINFDDPTSYSRLQDIEAAINRYEKVNKEIPVEWLMEKKIIEVAHNPYTL